MISVAVCPGQEEYDTRLEAILVLFRVPFFDQLTSRSGSESGGDVVIYGRDGRLLLSSLPETEQVRRLASLVPPPRRHRLPAGGPGGQVLAGRLPAHGELRLDHRPAGRPFLDHGPHHLLPVVPLPRPGPADRAFPGLRRPPGPGTGAAGEGEGESGAGGPALPDQPALRLQHPELHPPHGPGGQRRRDRADDPGPDAHPGRQLRRGRFPDPAFPRTGQPAELRGHHEGPLRRALRRALRNRRGHPGPPDPAADPAAGGGERHPPRFRRLGAPGHDPGHLAAGAAARGPRARAARSRRPGRRRAGPGDRNPGRRGGHGPRAGLRRPRERAAPACTTSGWPMSSAGSG